MRYTTPSMISGVRQHIEQLLACGFIRPLKSSWTSTVVLVRKMNGKLRFCVEFTVGSIGFFEYNKMPFGLTNSPATCQRLNEECLGDMNMNICLIYLDDLIIFSETFEQHLKRLEIVLTKLKACTLK